MRQNLQLCENLVKTGEDISREYGIPIVNKRIAVRPIAMLAGANPVQTVSLCKALVPRHKGKSASASSAAILRSCIRAAPGDCFN